MYNAIMILLMIFPLIHYSISPSPNVYVDLLNITSERTIEEYSSYSLRNNNPMTNFYYSTDKNKCIKIYIDINDGNNKQYLYRIKQVNLDKYIILAEHDVNYSMNFFYYDLDFRNIFYRLKVLENKLGLDINSLPSIDNALLMGFTVKDYLFYYRYLLLPINTETFNEYWGRVKLKVKNCLDNNTFFTKNNRRVKWYSRVKANEEWYNYLTSNHPINMERQITYYTRMIRNGKMPLTPVQLKKFYPTHEQPEGPEIQSTEFGNSDYYPRNGLRILMQIIVLCPLPNTVPPNKNDWISQLDPLNQSFLLSFPLYAKKDTPNSGIDNTEFQVPSQEIGSSSGIVHHDNSESQAFDINVNENDPNYNQQIEESNIDEDYDDNARGFMDTDDVVKLF